MLILMGLASETVDGLGFNRLKARKAAASLGQLLVADLLPNRLTFSWTQYKAFRQIPRGRLLKNVKVS